MVHSTGSDAYFDRFNNQEGKTGNKRMDYAREELVAELGAAVTAHRYGFDKHIKDDSAAYLKSWLGALKEDPSFLKTTLDDVKKATGLITGKIEDLRLDVREVQTVTIDVNSDGIADLAISESLADKKQGENERSNAAKESAPLEHVETHRAFHR
jgi:antirestriction protein ArdC